MSSNTVSDTMKTVSIARNIKRPTAREFIDQLFDEFMEFHGDRYYADDGAIVGGIFSGRTDYGDRYSERAYSRGERCL